MSEATQLDKFAQVVRKLDPHGTLLRAWALQGGVSAQVTALEIARPDGETQKLLVRQHGAVDRAYNPNIAADEYRLLQLLQSAGVAAPAPYLLDQSGEIFPAPYLVIAYIEGEPDVAPTDLSGYIRQFAMQLARIHAVDREHLDLSFLPEQTRRYAHKLRERPAILDDSLDEGHIRDTLASVWPPPQRNPSVLLHGDYWPGNILWHAGQLVAVIDWEDAAVGDPLFDLANSRLEILWAFGTNAMERFTQHYIAMNAIDLTNLPYWDLCAALRPASKLGEWAADAATEQRMRDGHRWFITQAFAKLSGRT
ncbi:MAG: putative phosphotransferase [Ktedonobacterales bacterium]|jgi:aminoglycoside phosphotransferase (APT) family kinase protein|nr:MAG: putative phosphotransferase [Ktedonobacterales bacterium]